MRDTEIEWTTDTLTCTTGCSMASAGCAHCYALQMTRRMQGAAQKALDEGRDPGRRRYSLDVLDDGRWNGRINVIEEALDEPFRWTTPRLVFVNSLSDLLHENVPEDFILRAIGRFGQAYRHEFQLLTKRADRVHELDPAIEWPENVWMGVSVEDERVVERIDRLQRTGAAVKFLSVEPMIGPLRGLDLSGIDWVICGGESGQARTVRPLEESWVLDLRDQCIDHDVPFFFKQWGRDGNNPDLANDNTAKSRGGHAKGGCLIQGEVWHEMPAALDPALAQKLYEKGLPDVEATDSNQVQEHGVTQS